MKRSIMKKLHSRSGETLTETLCALILIVLCSALLSAMLTATSYLNTKALEQDNRFYSELEACEAQVKGTGTPGTVTITAPDAYGSFPSFSIEVYGLEGGLKTYAMEEESTP